ncbi:PAS domain-containing protein [Deinococcus malanensis]|uniref:PAS domain-containing protein n=2 Tax=Deinococcus malanensis TaxID=1706855 RepID=UPI003635D2CC
MPDTEVITPLPHPVLTSLCRLIGDRLGADLVIVTDVQHTILASHSWPLSLPVPPLAALMTADMLVLTDTTDDPRFEPLADAMGDFRTGFYAAAVLRRRDGEPLGFLYLLRQDPRTFERQHYQAFLDAICLASDYLVQQQLLKRAIQVEARLLPFESSVEVFTDAVIVYNDAGLVTCANPAAEQLFGAPVNELEGQLLTALIPGGPDVLPSPDAETWQLGHVEGRTRKGGVLQLDIASRQMQVEDAHYTLLIRDMSDLNENIAALAQSQLHAQALLQAIPDSLFVLSKDGLVLNYKADSLRLERNPVGRSVYQLWSHNAAALIMVYLRLTLQGAQRSRAFVLEPPWAAKVLRNWRDASHRSASSAPCW